jgi:hypothetical protein
LAIAYADGNRFVSSNGGGVIGEYSTSGVLTNSHLITGLSEPTAELDRVRTIHQTRLLKGL